MRDTRFLDSSGLNPGNVSTAHDLALMVNAGYQYPLIRDFTTSSSHSMARCWAPLSSHGRVPQLQRSAA